MAGVAGLQHIIYVNGCDTKMGSKRTRGRPCKPGPLSHFYPVEFDRGLFRSGRRSGKADRQRDSIDRNRAAGGVKMAKIEQTAFAAADMTSWSKPHILAWTVSGSATAVRIAVGKAWCEEDPNDGWRAAKIEGIKVLKITMTADPQ